jgi:uncharacterized protein YktB (UPF0637 family)
MEVGNAKNHAALSACCVAETLINLLDMMSTHSFNVTLTKHFQIGYYENHMFTILLI